MDVPLPSAVTRPFLPIIQHAPRPRFTILISEIISKLIAEMDANTDKTTRCGTVSAERFSKSGSESVQKSEI